MNALTVQRPGALLLVEDLGRPGWAHLGVPRSGALDAPALRWANRLVGNDEGAAGLETLLTGCAFYCAAGCLVAVTGAPAPVTVDGRAASWGLPVHVRAGVTVEVGPALAGLRSYVAVSGGLTPPEVLGSRSADVLSGLGPSPLSTGDEVPVGDRPGRPAAVDVAPTRGAPADVRLRVRRGPRDDWLTPGAWRAFTAGAYEVTSDSDRVGVRVAGPALDRARDDELASEGIVLGAVQVPGDGQPLVFLADHPTTGGYPVVAVVAAADLPLLAQAGPGTVVGFTEVR